MFLSNCSFYQIVLSLLISSSSFGLMFTFSDMRMPACYCFQFAWQFVFHLLILTFFIYLLAKCISWELSWSQTRGPSCPTTGILGLKVCATIVTSPYLDFITLGVGWLVFTCGNAHVCTYMCKPEVSLRFPSLGAITLFIETSFFSGTQGLST